MTTRRTERGLTLIEILLAIIVMALGLVGIMALFPPALQTATESMEETQAAIIGESVAHALTTALANAVYDRGTKRYVAWLPHDLRAGGSRGRYEFVLPTGEPGADGKPKWYHYPGSASPPAKDQGKMITLAAYDAESDDCTFQLAGDAWTAATVKNVQDNYDPSDALGQFAFSFNVTKVQTLEHLRRPPPGETAPPEEELEAREKLYEFKIYVLRTAQMGSSGGTMVSGGGETVRWPICVLTKRIAVR